MAFSGRQIHLVNTWQFQIAKRRGQGLERCASTEITPGPSSRGNTKILPHVLRAARRWQARLRPDSGATGSECRREVSDVWRRFCQIVVTLQPASFTPISRAIFMSMEWRRHSEQLQQLCDHPVIKIGDNYAKSFLAVIKTPLQSGKCRRSTFSRRHVMRNPYARFPWFRWLGRHLAHFLNIGD